MRTQIDTVFSENLIEGNGEQEVVDVVAAQVRVAVGGLYLEDAVAQFEDGDVERAAAKIVDGNGAFLGAIEAIGQRSRGRFIDQAQDVKACHAACVLGGLALRIVEVRRDGDNGLRDRLAEETFSIALELAQDVRGNFGGREPELAELNARDFTGLDIVSQAERKETEFAADLFNAASHEALHGINDALRRLNERFARTVAHGNCGATALSRNGVERHH